MQEAIAIPGYTITRELGEGGTASVYLGNSDDHNTRSSDSDSPAGRRWTHCDTRRQQTPGAGTPETSRGRSPFDHKHHWSSVELDQLETGLATGGAVTAPLKEADAH